jgi:hypothetical protein
VGALKSITDTGRANLAFASILMTYECGMRFLTDHFDGDAYFRIRRENHNLDRARTDFGHGTRIQGYIAGRFGMNHSKSK